MFYIYADPDDEQEKEKTQMPVTIRGHVTEVDLGTHKIKVIDPDYVVSLERRVMMLEQTIRQQQQAMVQLRNEMTTRRAESTVLQRQIDGKVNRS
jgi:hypothetical protein